MFFFQRTGRLWTFYSKRPSHVEACVPKVAATEENTHFLHLFDILND